MSTTEDAIRSLVASKLGVDKDKVTRDASFVDDLNADSLDTVELVLALEEEFGIEISDDDAATMLTLGDVLDYVEKHAKKATQA